MSVLLRTTSLILGLVGWTACQGDIDVVGPSSTVVRPAQVDALSLPVESYALDSDLVGDSTLSVAMEADGSVFVGGAAGLYRLTSSGWTVLDPTPVMAMANLPEIGVIVGSAQGVSLFTDTLEATGLTEALSSMNVATLAARGNELWVGAVSELYQWQDDQLVAFLEPGPIVRVDTFSEALSLVLTDTQGRPFLFRETNGVFSWQPLDDEILADRVVPGMGDRLFANVGGRLMERVQDAGQVSWRPVALTLDPEDRGASIEAMAVDPSNGAVWVLTPDALAKITADRVGLQPRPSNLSGHVTLSVTADGTAWLADAATLVKVGGSDASVTWETSISAFSADNCERCHTALGTARPLDTYEAWVQEIDPIIDAVDAGRMPLDEMPLVGGSVETLRQWKEDGLLR